LSEDRASLANTCGFYSGFYELISLADFPELFVATIAFGLTAWDLQIDKRAVPVELEKNNRAIQVQIAPLLISQPNNQIWSYQED